MNTELKRKQSAREIEQIYEAAQQRGKSSLASISTKHVRDVEIVVGAIGDKPLSLNIEISVIQGDRRGETSEILDEATRLPLDAADSKARDLGL